MKALSIRQPWAELILQGHKTMDLRTYTVAHRGPLAIHVPKKVERQACLRYDLDPGTLPAGGVVGIVELVDVIPLSESDYASQRDEHLATRGYRSPMFGWVLRAPRRLPEMVPLPGRRNLFNVELDIGLEPSQTDEKQNTPSKSEAPAATISPTPELDNVVKADGPSYALPFELQVVARPAGSSSATGYALTLRQREVQETDSQLYLYNLKPQPMTTLATLSGDQLRAVADHVIEAIRLAGYKATDLSATRTEPFYLPEATGVRLGLVFMTVRPLSKLSRVEAISQGIRRMPPEEAYYWYSKCTARDTALRAQKALRVMLAAE